MPSKTKSSTPAAILAVEDAMKLVEEAQVKLEYATQKLSAIRHGSDLYAKAGKLRDSCHTLFYQLARAARGNHLGTKRDGMSLDSEPEVR
jgi:hypothetical protein